MFRNPLILSTLLSPSLIWAQSSADRNPFDNADVAILDPGFSGGQLLLAIAAGVVLAFCFQWLLTNLTAALGISALQGITDQGRRARRRAKESEKERKKAQGEASDPERAGRAYAERISGEEEEGWDHTAVKLESGLGLWALITSCLALFFATWLAVELIRMQNNLQGAILGLVIWGVFMGTMMRLEAAMASSLLGFVAGKAREGVGALLSPARAAVGAIADSRQRAARREETVQTAEEVAAAVRRELFPEKEWAPESPAIGEKIRDFVRANVKPKAMDAARLGQEVKALLTDPEIIEMAKRGELMDLDRDRFAGMVAGRTDLDKDQVEKMVDALHGAWSRFLGEHAHGRPGERPVAEPAGAVAAAGKSPGVAAKYRQFKEFLRSTGREELRPERLEEEVKTLVLDPQAGITQLKEHFRELDRESLVQALGARKDMTPDEARRIAEQIDLARSKVLSAREQAEHRAGEMRDRILAKIRDHVYAAHRPELDYEGFESDFRLLFDDPKAGYAALKERLQGIDRESVIALLSTQEGIGREKAEKMVEKGEQATAKAGEMAEAAKAGIAKAADKIVAAKEAVLERARMIEDETRRRLEAAKRASLEQAEAARKVSATAAWWMLAIGCASAAAALLGGLAAAST
jgi:hypothetical protein